MRRQWRMQHCGDGVAVKIGSGIMPRPPILGTARGIRATERPSDAGTKPPQSDIRSRQNKTNLTQINRAALEARPVIILNS